MKRLQVNNCGVTEIDPAVWERLSILEYLSLRENHIRNLDFRDSELFPLYITVYYITVYYITVYYITVHYCILFTVYYIAVYYTYITV